jgi:alpha-ribazole phosphatase
MTVEKLCGLVKRAHCFRYTLTSFIFPTIAWNWLEGHAIVAGRMPTLKRSMMKVETRFWLIRHAPVARPSGVVHDDNAPADTRDVAAIAALRSLLPQGAVAFVSPARRTMETAIALGLAATPEPSFREQDFGSWMGRRHAQLAQAFGHEYAKFWQSPAENVVPGGESFVNQISRVRERLATLPDGDVVLVIHSGTIRAVLAAALELAPNNALGFVIDPLSLTRVDRLTNGWRVVCVNQRV